VVIHLLNKTFPKGYLFSNVAQLRKTAAQRSKLYTLRHLLLLLARTLFLLFLLFTFLRPVWMKYGQKAHGKAERHVLILIDHSLSMEFDDGGAKPLKKAVVEAGRIIRALGADDLLNVLLVSHKVHPCFTTLSGDHVAAHQFLRQVEPGSGLADFSAGNRSAARAFPDDGANREIYYLSDFQRKNWADVDFSMIPPDVRLFYVDIGAPSRDNRGFLEASFSAAEAMAGSTIRLEARVGNYSDERFEGPVTLLINNRVKLDKTIQLEPWSQSSVAFPILVQDRGLLQGVLTLPPDRQPGDDRFFVTLPVMDQEKVFIVSDHNDEATANYFIETALNPFDEDGGSIDPELHTTAALNKGLLASTRKVFVTGAAQLADDRLALLESYVFQGGNLIYFLDGKHDVENLKGLEKLCGGIPLLPSVKREIEQVAQGGQQIVQGEFNSPYLKLFKGPQRQNLAQLEFYDFYYAAAGGKGRVLLTYADETPAMAELQHGLGTMLFMNFSVDEWSSNLARKKIFPAWMHDLL
ncbi:MAG: VWA domain-containing protein, partial [Verrucomicrobiota bacterium]